jgi:putative flavoprotein involved in K+ transport
MSVERVEVVVVGAGQAGLAMSEHLTHLGISHLVLERGEIAHRWRHERWDSLVTNGPLWHDRFPSLAFEGAPDSFATKDEVADYFVQFADATDSPVRTGVEVTKVARREGARGFAVTTSAGPIEADFVVSATGAFQVPVIPPIVPEGTVATQIHSSSYRNPDQLPEGAVLVVGAGSSGVQIADELRRAGREVYLSVGPHDRPPRSYRGRDFCWWLGVLGLWDAATPAEGAEHVTIAVSGARGGHTVDFRDLAQIGIHLLGRTTSCVDGTLHVGADLADNIDAGDASYLGLLQAADEYVERFGLDLPTEPRAHVLGPLPESVTSPQLTLDLAAAGVNSIVWATGFTTDYAWLDVDAFDDSGKPEHRRGVTAEPGVYFLGLPWLSRRGSSFIWGVWHDAKFLADQIAIQRSYRDYQP